MDVLLVVYATGFVIQLLSTIAIRCDVKETARRFSWPTALLSFGGACVLWPLVVLFGAVFGAKETMIY